MRDEALVVMHARDIRVCLDSLRALDLPRVWVSGFTERGIEREAWPQVMDQGFEWLWLVSDDVVVRQHTLDLLRGLRDAGSPVVTGYSQRTHDEWVVNLTRGPLQASHPSPEAYDFMQYREVVAWPTEQLQTWFAGASVTGMSAEMWERFPFGCFGDEARGYGSDFSLSLRLQQQGVPIVAHRDALCYHWRHRWQNTAHPQDQEPVFGEATVTVA